MEFALNTRANAIYAPNAIRYYGKLILTPVNMPRMADLQAQTVEFSVHPKSRCERAKI